MFRTPKALKELKGSDEFRVAWNTQFSYTPSNIIYVLALTLFALNTICFIFNCYSFRGTPVAPFANLLPAALILIARDRALKKNLASILLGMGIRPSFCGRCEYDLRATNGNRCPECGAEIATKPE